MNSSPVTAIRVATVGGPEVLRPCPLPVPAPKPTQVRVEIAYAGVNYIDVYHRTGLYPLPMPFTPGLEGAGVIAEVGPDVTGLQVGDRVAFATCIGAYARTGIFDAERLVPVPDTVPLDVAAAVLLQGMTAHYLTHDICPLKPGDVALVHAAAGGVGLLLVQMLKGIGVQVLATVGSKEKAARVYEAKADHVIEYRHRDFVEEVLAFTDGAGARVVFDGVGRATFDGSLRCLSTRAMLALFGQASGPVPPFEPRRLATGSLFLTRPALHHYVATRAELVHRAGAVFTAVGSGDLKVHIHSLLPLAEAAKAHQLLEGRQTSGKLLLET